MSWKAICAVASWCWAMTAFAQAPPRIPAAVQPPSATRAQERALTELAKRENPNVCAIPLTEVRVPEKSPPMPNFQPPAEPESDVDHMPFMPLPAPPCEGEKR